MLLYKIGFDLERPSIFCKICNKLLFPEPAVPPINKNCGTSNFSESDSNSFYIFSLCLLHNLFYSYSLFPKFQYFVFYIFFFFISIAFFYIIYNILKVFVLFFCYFKKFSKINFLIFFIFQFRIK